MTEGKVFENAKVDDIVVFKNRLFGIITRVLKTRICVGTWPQERKFDFDGCEICPDGSVTDLPVVNPATQSQIEEYKKQRLREDVCLLIQNSKPCILEKIKTASLAQMVTMIPNNSHYKAYIASEILEYIMDSIEENKLDFPEILGFIKLIPPKTLQDKEVVRRLKKTLHPRMKFAKT